LAFDDLGDDDLKATAHYNEGAVVSPRRAGQPQDIRRSNVMERSLVPKVHHGYHPDFLHGAANAITSKHRVSVVESVVDLESARERRQKA
jgi:hypothetical protein